MADGQATLPPTTTNGNAARKASISGASAGLAGGGGSAGVITFFWNWYAVKEWGAPQMDVGTAVALALLLAPVIHYGCAWLPMPSAREHRN